MGQVGKVAASIAQNIPGAGTIVGLTQGKSIGDSLLMGLPGGAVAQRAKAGMETAARRPGEIAAEEAAKQGDAMKEMMQSQEKFARDQMEALKSAPRKVEDPGMGYDQELKDRMRRFRSGFAQNIKTSPLGLLNTTATAKPGLTGTKLGA